MTTIPFTLDQNSKVKLHFQLYKNVVDSIVNGSFKTGQKLPSVRTMAQTLSISRNTVIAAYKQLCEEGYISSREKSGYIVNKIPAFSDAPGTATVTVSSDEDSQIPTVDNVFKQRKGTEIQHIPVPEDLSNESVTTNKDEIHESITPKTEPPALDYSEKQLRKQTAFFLYNQRHVTCTSNQIIIDANITVLLRNIYHLLFKPVSTTGKGLLKLAEAAADGSLTLRQGTLAISENAPEDFVEAAHSLGIRTVIIHTDKKGINVSDLDMYNVTAVIVFPYSWATDHYKDKTIEESTSNEPEDKFIDPRDDVSPRKKALLEWASKKEDRFIIEYDFEHSQEAEPALQYYDKKNKVIYLSSLSEGIVMTNNTFSYLVLPPKLISTYHDVFGAESCTLSREEFLEASDTFLSGNIYKNCSI